MALAAGEIVAPATAVTPGGAAVNDQVEMRGVVAAANGAPIVTDVDVLWASGLQEAGILVGAVDRIDPPAVASLGLQGQIVRRVLNASGITASAAYDGLVLELYKRTPAGGAVSTPDIALVKTLQNGALFEVLASNLKIVT